MVRKEFYIQISGTFKETERSKLVHKKGKKGKKQASKEGRKEARKEGQKAQCRVKYQKKRKGK